jgi:predicted dienelactone hydrolase
MKRLTAALAFMAILCTHSAQAQFSAGFTQKQLATSATHTIDVAIWYPSHSSEAPLTFGPTTMMVSNNGEPIQKKHPLVLLSHGTGGMNLNNHEIAAAIARAGFIVVALTHPGDNYKDRSLVGKLPYFTERINWVDSHPVRREELADAFLMSPQTQLVTYELGREPIRHPSMHQFLLSGRV